MSLASSEQCGLPDCSRCNFAGTQNELLREIAANIGVMCVKLFGSDMANNENDKGRLPMVEAEVTRAHERLDKLEKRIMWAAGFAAAVGSGITILVQHF